MDSWIFAQTFPQVTRPMSTVSEDGEYFITHNRYFHAQKGHILRGGKGRKSNEICISQSKGVKYNEKILPRTLMPSSLTDCFLPVSLYFPVTCAIIDFVIEKINKNGCLTWHPCFVLNETGTFAHFDLLGLHLGTT